MAAFLALVLLGLAGAAALYKKERYGLAPVKQTQQVKSGVIAALVGAGLLLLILACN
jgi:hypothetical protein